MCNVKELLLSQGGGGGLLARKHSSPHTFDWFPHTLAGSHSCPMVPTARGSVSRDMLHCPANQGATRTANATTPTSASLTQTMATRQLDSQAQHSTPRTQIPLCYARSEQPIQTQTPKRLEVGQ